MAGQDVNQYQLFTGQAASASLSPDGLDDAKTATDELPYLAEDDSRLRLCVLGSGSGGNSTAVSHAGRVLLIDAGFGPRVLTQRLALRNATLSHVQAICLTHLDRDHFQPNLLRLLMKWHIPVYLHEQHLKDYWCLEKSREFYDAGLVKVFTSRQFSPMPGLTLRAIRLAHDSQGSYAFKLETDMASIGYATDLGHVPQDLLSHFANVNLLAIESNYDPALQMASSRPGFLKQRIMGGAGHLSNEQCLDAIRTLISQSQQGGPARIVLLHRSRQCNCPNIIQQLYEHRTDFASRMTLSEQDAPSPWLVAGR